MSFLQSIFGLPDAARLEAKRDVRGLTRALGYSKSSGIRQTAANSLARIDRRP